MPVSVHLEGRVLGQGGPRDDDPPARGVLRPARPRPADRVRRGLPDRSLGRPRPRRLPHRAGRRHADAGAGEPAAAAGPGRRRPPRHERSTRANSRRNIAHHYDLSNDLFELFLDPSLSYSSALFAADALHGDRVVRMSVPRAGQRPGRGPGAQDRAAARPTGVGAGLPGARDRHRLGRARDPGRAARRDLVHSITLSTEQKALAERRIAEAGLSDRVTVELLDYRALPRPTRRTTPWCRWR